MISIDKIGATLTRLTTVPTKRISTSTRDLYTYRQVAITKQQLLYLYFKTVAHNLLCTNSMGPVKIWPNLTSIRLLRVAIRSKLIITEANFNELIFNSYKFYITSRISSNTSLRFVRVHWYTARHLKPREPVSPRAGLPSRSLKFKIVDVQNATQSVTKY